MHPEKLAGHVLGHYRLLRPLGYGGTAMVFLAEDINLKREVAVKIFEPQRGNSKDFLRRFAREARVLAQLDHPHIVPVYAYGEQDTFAYLVMPFMAGGSLRDRLQQTPIIRESEALSIIEKLLSALHYAHERGLIHRDIKPGNVLFKADGTPLLSDFGLVKILPTAKNSSIEETASMAGNLIAGTPDYMAPEQINGQPEPSSDIYATGAMLHEMLTGKRLFDAETSLGVLVKHLNETPVPARQLNASISADVERIVLRTVAKTAPERYPSAAALRQALLATHGQEFSVSEAETITSYHVQDDYDTVATQEEMHEVALNAMHDYKGMYASGDVAEASTILTSDITAPTLPETPLDAINTLIQQPDSPVAEPPSLDSEDDTRPLPLESTNHTEQDTIVEPVASEQTDQPTTEQEHPDSTPLDTTDDDTSETYANTTNAAEDATDQAASTAIETTEDVADHTYSTNVSADGAEDVANHTYSTSTSPADDADEYATSETAPPPEEVHESVAIEHEEESAEQEQHNVPENISKQPTLSESEPPPVEKIDESPVTSEKTGEQADSDSENKEKVHENATKTFSTTPIITEVHEKAAYGDELPDDIETALSLRVLARSASLAEPRKTKVLNSTGHSSHPSHPPYPAQPQNTPVLSEQPAYGYGYGTTPGLPQPPRKNAFIPVLITMCLLLLIVTTGLGGALYMFQSHKPDQGLNGTPTGQAKPGTTPTTTITPTGTPTLTPTQTGLTPRATAPVVVPVKPDCPTIGTVNVANMPAISLGDANTIIYLENLQDAQGKKTAFLKRRAIVEGTKDVVIAKIDNASINTAQLSQDQQWILFTATINRQDQLHLVSVTGKHEQTLYCSGSTRQSIQSPQWSYDNRYVIFNNLPKDEQPTTYLIDIQDGSIKTELEPTADGAFVPELWIDNTRVYVSSLPTNAPGERVNLYLLDLNKGPKQQLDDLKLVYTASLTCASFDTGFNEKQLFLSTCQAQTNGNAIQPVPPSTVLRGDTSGTDPKLLYKTDELAITAVRSLNETTLLLIAQSASGADQGIWTYNPALKGGPQQFIALSGKKLRFNEYSHNIWANVTGNETLLAFNAVNTSTGLASLYTANFKGELNEFAKATSLNTQLQIVGWTTL